MKRLEVNDREQLEELILRLTDLVSQNQLLLAQTSELFSKALETLEALQRVTATEQQSKEKTETEDLEFYMGL